MKKIDSIFVQTFSFILMDRLYLTYKYIVISLFTIKLKLKLKSNII